MSSAESDELFDKVTAGVKLAIKRLIEKTKKEDGELVVARNGKVVVSNAKLFFPFSNSLMRANIMRAAWNETVSG